MKKNDKLMVYLLIGLIIFLPTACYRASNTLQGSTNYKMLMDTSRTSAPHALVTLQERPLFQLDDMKRPIAMKEDSIKKTKAYDKPLTIKESALK